LILMDMHLSEINGIEASQRIKAASSGWKQPKIIAYTANQFIQKEPAALETFDGFLIKPVSIEAFSDEIVKVFTMDKQGN
jgi:CheY-like chemotaxis protein